EPAEVEPGDEILGRAPQGLALFPVDVLPGLAVTCRGARLHLHEHEGVPLESDQVELPRAGAMAAGQDVVARADQEAAGQPFPAANQEQVRRGHGGIVYPGPRLFHRFWGRAALPAVPFAGVLELEPAGEQLIAD